MNQHITISGVRSTRNARTASILVATMLVLGLASLAGGLAAAHGATSYNNVQVSINTSSSLSDYFYVSAYNSTGSLVASYQSHYPAAAFELPSGAYIFTATASQQQTVYYFPGGYSTATAASGSAGASSGTVLPPVKCCGYSPAAVEYGYASQQVAGSTSLTISTEPLNQTATSSLAIKVNYPNGTAASGVYVSASVLGDTYGWAYSSGGNTMYGNTNTQGAVTLVTPKAPVLVSASTSIPIVLPYNQTTVQVTVAGEKVNVTAYWQPNYLTFSAQTLVMPPATSATMVLRYEPQLYGPVVYAPGATTEGVPTAGTGANTATTYVITQHVTAPQSSATSQAASGNGSLMLISGVAAAISLAALGVAVFALRTRLRQVAP